MPHLPGCPSGSLDFPFVPLASRLFHPWTFRGRATLAGPINFIYANVS